MIEVAVVGAGPAGLVTARHLLANGLRCCIFEASSAMGGAWSSPAAAPIEGQGLVNGVVPDGSNAKSPMWNGLRTNLSKHTCRFSDFPWPEETPTFPSKDDMDWYLTSYAEQFLDPSCSFKYDCKVTRISPIGGGFSRIGNKDEKPTGNDQRYRIEWTDTIAQTKHSKEFEGVVLATGFFSKPKYPKNLKQELVRRTNRDHDNDVERDDTGRMKIIHSKEYSSHDSFSSCGEGSPQKIVVAGGSHSALEIAVDLTKSAETPITVVASRIPWIVPRYVPSPVENGGNGNNGMILPVDLALYRRTHDRGKVEEKTTLTEASCREQNEHLRALLGPLQETILSVPSFNEPPLVAVSDHFLNLVADGRIEVICGRVEGVTDDGKGVKISRSSGDSDFVLSGVTSLLCCTGYLSDLESCCGSLSEKNDDRDPGSLPSILEMIDYDPNDSFSPWTSHLETLHPDLPNFAFVGMYRGPYMGVVELQARLAAGALSGTMEFPLPETFKKGLETSAAIRNPAPSFRPQFPRFDYIGFMDSLSECLSEQKFPTANICAGDLVTPAFYQPDKSLVESGKSELDREVERAKSGYYLPQVVTSALVGNWTFERDIVHFSGKSIAQRQYIHGKVRYSRSKDHGHVLYREDGFFEVSPSKSLPVFREYEYVCSTDERGGDSGAMELYFVEGGTRAYIFLSLRFGHKDEDGYWVATNEHLCVKDLYKANFRIKMDGLAATEVIITYRVRGPAKDYESTTVMRPA